MACDYESRGLFGVGERMKVATFMFANYYVRSCDECPHKTNPHPFGGCNLWGYRKRNELIHEACALKDVKTVKTLEKDYSCFTRINGEVHRCFDCPHFGHDKETPMWWQMCKKTGDLIKDEYNINDSCPLGDYI